MNWYPNMFSEENNVLLLLPLVPLQLNMKNRELEELRAQLNLSEGRNVDLQRRLYGVQKSPSRSPPRKTIAAVAPQYHNEMDRIEAAAQETDVAISELFARYMLPQEGSGSGTVTLSAAPIKATTAPRRHMVPPSSQNGEDTGAHGLQSSVDMQVELLSKVCASIRSINAMHCYYHITLKF